MQQYAEQTQRTTRSDTAGWDDVDLNGNSHRPRPLSTTSPTEHLQPSQPLEPIIKGALNTQYDILLFTVFPL